MSHADTVKEIYAAFGRGDVHAIIEKLDDNVEWDVESPTPGVPWLQSRRGKTNVAAFFESLAPLHFASFEPHSFFEDGNRVMALVHMEIDYKPSGKHYSFPHEGHLWVFNTAGKVEKYQHITDTAQHQRMVKGE